jgi:ribosomal protein S2
MKQKPLKLFNIIIEKFLKKNMHLGRDTRLRNHLAKIFVFNTFKNIDLIILQRTLTISPIAIHLIRSVVGRRGSILIIFPDNSATNLIKTNASVHKQLSTLDQWRPGKISNIKALYKQYQQQKSLNKINNLIQKIKYLKKLRTKKKLKVSKLKKLKVSKLKKLKVFKLKKLKVFKVKKYLLFKVNKYRSPKVNPYRIHSYKVNSYRVHPYNRSPRVNPYNRSPRVNPYRSHKVNPYRSHKVNRYGSHKVNRYGSPSVNTYRPRKIKPYRPRRKKKFKQRRPKRKIITYLPELVITLHHEKMQEIAREAMNIKIPSICVCTTEQNPDVPTHPILANNTIKNTKVFAKVFMKAIIWGYAHLILKFIQKSKS